MASLPSDDNQLSWICSSLTLQSEQKGFFQTFAETVIAVGGDKWLAAFAKSKIDKDRLLCCLNHPQVKDVVHCTLGNIQKLFRSKSGRFARDKREEAEHYLSRGQLPQAALSANIGVARAPFPDVDKTVDDGLTLPLCLRTRCKVMLAMNNYKAALEDVQLALKYKVPDGYKLEAYVVMSDCYLKTSEKEKAKISWTIVSKLAELQGNFEIKDRAQMILNDLDAHVLASQETNTEDTAELFDGDSRAVPGTSSAISMKRTSEKGRYMVANCKIPVGATLAFEEPYASVLKFDKHNNHCLNCYTRVNRVVPCPTCSGVTYCSIPCATEGHVYHQWECPYMELIIGSGMSVSAVLSMRMITQFSVEYFLQLFNAIQENDEHPHLRVYNLETHSKTRDTKDFVYRTLMALLQLEILRASGYFGVYGSIGFDKLTDAEITVGCLLLRHLQLTQYNTHEIYESVVMTKDKTVESKSSVNVNDAKMNYVGLALYPSSSYFNHECQPTLARFFIGKTLVLRAERPIQMGEEVNENYGPSFLYKLPEDRKRILNARYRFKCNCIPCKDSWPPLSTLSTKPADIYRCSKDRCKGLFKYEEGQAVVDWSCLLCKEMNNLENQISLNKVFRSDYDEGMRLLESGKVAEAEAMLSKFIEESSELITQPNYLLTCAMESLRNAWASHANFFVI